MCLVGFAWSDVGSGLVEIGWASKLTEQRSKDRPNLYRSIVFQWWMAMVVVGLMSVGVCVVEFVADVVVVVVGYGGGGC